MKKIGILLILSLVLVVLTINVNAATGHPCTTPAPGDDCTGIGGDQGLCLTSYTNPGGTLLGCVWTGSTCMNGGAVDECCGNEINDPPEACDYTASPEGCGPAETCSSDCSQCEATTCAQACINWPTNEYDGGVCSESLPCPEGYEEPIDWGIGQWTDCEDYCCCHSKAGPEFSRTGIIAIVAIALVVIGYLVYRKKKKA